MKWWERKYLEFIYSQYKAIYKNVTPQIILTFDDGPHKKNTEKIISILNERKLRAYFFIINNEIFTPEIYSPNNQIVSLHANNHIPANSPDYNFNNDLQFLQLINKLQNKPVKYIRPPYGLFNQRYLNFVKENSLKLMMWNHTTYDYKNNIPKTWAQNICSRVKTSDILLLHDSPKTANLYPDGLNYLLDGLEKRKIKIGVLPKDEEK